MTCGLCCAALALITVTENISSTYPLERTPSPFFPLGIMCALPAFCLGWTFNLPRARTVLGRLDYGALIAEATRCGHLQSFVLSIPDIVNYNTSLPNLFKILTMLGEMSQVTDDVPMSQSARASISLVLRLQSEDKYSSTFIVMLDAMSSKCYDLLRWLVVNGLHLGGRNVATKVNEVVMSVHALPNSFYVPVSLLRNPSFLASQIISNIQTLDLSDCNIGSREGLALSKCLTSSRLLKTDFFHNLILSKNDIGEPAALALINMALASPFIRCLDVDNNRFDICSLLRNELTFSQRPQILRKHSLHVILHLHVAIRHGGTQCQKMLVLNGFADDELLAGMLRIVQTTSQFRTLHFSSLTATWAHQLLKGTLVSSVMCGDDGDGDDSHHGLGVSVASIRCDSVDSAVHSISEAIVSSIECKKGDVASMQIEERKKTKTLLPSKLQRWGSDGKSMKEVQWLEGRCTYVRRIGHLQLHYNKFSVHDVPALKNVLTMPALRHLDLSHNVFGDEGALALCMAMLDVCKPGGSENMPPSRLHSLDVCDCRLSNVGARHLIVALTPLSSLLAPPPSEHMISEENHAPFRLRSLDLRSNNLDDAFVNVLFATSDSRETRVKSFELSGMPCSRLINGGVLQRLDLTTPGSGTTFPASTIVATQPENQSPSPQQRRILSRGEFLLLCKYLPSGNRLGVVIVLPWHGLALFLSCYGMVLPCPSLAM